MAITGRIESVSPADLGEHILRARQKLMTRRSIGGVGFMHAYSDLIDSVVRRIVDMALKDIGADDALDGVCVIAVGGYGRQELSPHSDIDITFVAEEEGDPAVDRFLKTAYRLVMDVFLNGAGLKVGYGYRGADDCRDLSLETHTSLLDARHLAGSPMFFERFSTACRRAIVPASFVLGHLEQRRIAIARSGGSPYRIEPDIKDGAGGLRDLHAARWIAQSAFSTSREDVWHVLRSRGVISDQEMKWIGDAAEFLFKVRNALHAVCESGRDILAVDRQQEVASRLGMEASDLMGRYMLHAERIAAIYRKVTTACGEESLEIEPGVVVRRGEIRIADKGILRRDPEAAVRLHEHAVRLGLGIDWETSDLVKQYVSGRRAERLMSNGNGVAMSNAFLRILSLPGAATALDAMNRTGVLRALLPEFGRLMYLVPGDPAHELSVGAHSLEVARQIELLTSGADDEFYDVRQNVREPELLYLSALLHDIGKADDGDGPHQERGRSSARRIAERLGMTGEAVDMVEFLVANHSLMSETARMRDLGEQPTIRDFTAVVTSAEALDMLYLLTAADVRSVGQATWSEVQMRFLRELYHRAASALRASSPVTVDIERHRGRLARELSLANIPQEEIDEHCRAMPASYLLNTAPDELAAHITYARSARSGKPVVRLRDDPTGPFTELTVCVLDDPTPGLLAKITGVLAALGVEIHAAQVFTRESRDRIAIDLLYVDSERRPLPELKAQQVQSELEMVLSGDVEVESLFPQFGRRITGDVGLTDLRVMGDLSDQHSIVEIEAEDTPGLLYRLTTAISSMGWNIHSARVTTWGRRARDAFYVTGEGGSKLPPDAAETLRPALESSPP